MNIRTLLRVFLPFAAGYFLSYLYRVVNAVIAPDLIADIGVGPSDLGLLTAIYFIAFASFQLPLGILLDRFGPRKVESIILLFAAIGAFLFASAESLTGLVVGRAFIGFGVSACLMAAFKSFTQWFPKEKWPLVNGCQMAAGGLGALAATSPVEIALHFTNWRGLFYSLAALSLIVAVTIFFIVPEKKSSAPKEHFSDQLQGIKEIFTSGIFWKIAPLTTMSQASFLAIQGLWAGPWLTHVAGIERIQVANLLFWVAVSMIAGFILLGSLVGQLGKRGISLEKSGVFGMTIFMVVQLLLIIGPTRWYVPIWLAFGFFGTSGIIAYSSLSQAFPTNLSGRVTTALNLLVFVAAFAGQWVIGTIIGIFSKGLEDSFSPAGFHTGFGLMLLLELGGLAYYLFATRRNHR
jgi:MFS family permease